MEEVASEVRFKDGLYLNMENTGRKEIRMKAHIWFQSSPTTPHSVAATQMGEDWGQIMEGLEYPLKSRQQIKAKQSNEAPVRSEVGLCLNTWLHRPCGNHFLVAPYFLTQELEASIVFPIL